MKIVFQHVPSWENKPVAEIELGSRLLKASEKLGIDALATGTLGEISAFNPDIIFPLHFFIPKLFDAYTIGCMWNPVYALERNNAWDNVKTYDGFAVASDSQRQLISALKFKSPLPYLITDFYPSTNQTSYVPPESFTRPVYIGSNWDTGRHADFFEKAGNIHIYGPKANWRHISQDVYRGEVDFDGESSLAVYRQAGIGLALHNDQHNREAIPSMRPFEIAASGALMIADHNPFIREHFKDTVLYVDTEQSSRALTEQLDDHVNWCLENEKTAREMSEAAHTLFQQQFSLEVLLEKVIKDVREFGHAANTMAESVVATPDADAPEVEIVVRTNGDEHRKLFRALGSIRDQDYSNVTAHLVYFGPVERLDDLQNAVTENLPDLRCRYTLSGEHTDRGNNFFKGLRSVTAPYCGFLDHDDVLFQNHVKDLLACLLSYPQSVLAYSGAIRVWDDGTPPENEEIRKLAYFQDRDHFQTERFITSNAYLVRTGLLPWHLLNQPVPVIDVAEDRIFLEQLYRSNPSFIFSEKVTCAFFWSLATGRNTVFGVDGKDQPIKFGDFVAKCAATRMSYEVKVPPDERRGDLTQGRVVAGLKNGLSRIKKLLD